MLRCALELRKRGERSTSLGCVRVCDLEQHSLVRLDDERAVAESHAIYSS